MSYVKKILAVDPDSGRTGYLDIASLTSNLPREGEALVLRRGDVLRRDVVLVYPGLYEYDPSTQSLVYRFKHYIGKDRPKLYPKCEVVERSLDYILVRRHDGVLFKLADFDIAEVLLNVIINPGLTLTDIINIELTIWGKEAPKAFEEDAEFPTILAENVVDSIGFFAYVLDLIEIKF